MRLSLHVKHVIDGLERSPKIKCHSAPSFSSSLKPLIDFSNASVRYQTFAQKKRSSPNIHQYVEQVEIDKG